MADGVLSRIDAWLAEARRPDVAPAAPAPVTVPPEVVEACAELQHRLSGAFGEVVEVGAGAGDEAGAYFAAVPVRLLQSSGLRMVEAVAPARSRSLRRDEERMHVLVGTAEAVVNAERRVAKYIGEGWRVVLDSYPCAAGADAAAWFRVDRVAK